ncbi:MAG: recombinase family protein [Candidatus Omnitrophica bacterium]|nr:recombinase family protein [Candidatus Omnitrophota bacterium]
MNKAVILARVSTLKQEEEGLSLDNQLNTLRSYAKQNDFDVIKEFRFSESADSKIRKKFCEMIEFVKNDTNIKVIIAYRVDRITRNYRDAVLIDDLRTNFNKEIHFVYDRLVIAPKTVGRDITDWDTKVYLAKQFLNRLKEDAVVSIKHKLNNGEYPSMAPYGYTNIVNEDRKKWIAPDSLESKVVIKIYEWYATGAFSMDLIRKKLKEEFCLDFHKGTVDSILKNPFYYGEMLHCGKLYPHKYKTIISKELFDKAQEVKAGFNKKSFKFVGLPYLYRGLIKCAKCGCRITPEKKKGKYVYYHCTQYYGKHSDKWIREEDLTRQFADLMNKIHLPDDIVESISKTLRESHEDKVNYYNNLNSELQTEYGKYEKRIEKMYEDYLDGRITEDMYNKLRQDYRIKQEEIQDKLNSLQKSDEEYYETASYILKVANKAPQLFESSEPEIKRQLLKLTLQNCELKDATLCPTIRRPFSIFAEGSSRQNWLPLVDSNHGPGGYT